MRFADELMSSDGFFTCIQSTCKARTCRKCNQQAHPNMTCEQAAPAEIARKQLEEAASDALLRQCRHCKARFYKEEGCNKMVCRCGAIMCWLCRQDLDRKQPYLHFCQTPHCEHKRCGKCVLWPKDDVANNAATVRTAIEQAKRDVAAAHPELAATIDKLAPAAPAPPPRAGHRKGRQ